ncbi:TnsA endonuclease N-terminal domain-containing protein [Arcobacter butzleri]|uniref:TnsA endonuclease N-terminal domain-containing protein n=1 Tax=Aliarcobacter butzleri TaxID=28197 RepID=UPI0015877C1C|nr:TnsA endonuclease N-terminal domain-containing protein [Aliarcobacter butzleri]NUW25064.1 TnsA endonuclease N-terminal domain-containing protein [Aliarcobacter butzleri]
MRISHKNRKIGYTYGSTSGKFMFRNKKIILFESLLEKSFLQVLEFNDMVLDVVEQPFTIETETTKGNKGSYTPDFLIYFKEPQLKTNNPIKPIVAEVKTSKKLIENRIKLKQKFKSAIKFCNEQEFRFKIFNENRIKSAEVDNIVFLNRYKDYRADEDEIEIIKNHLLSVGHTTIEYLLTHLYVTDYQKGNALSHIWYLMYSKVLVTDLKIPLNNKTVIWLNIEEDNLGVEL